jgi:ubiquinone/menaquinone biosynthesis C-methylase UbiE
MFDRSLYFASQNARVAWFLGQYLLSNRLSRPVARRSRASPRRRRSAPTLRELLADIAALLRRDWTNIRNGVYRAPPPALDEAGRLLDDALRYFRDLPEVAARRRRNGFDDVRQTVAAAGALPDYYRRNFHFQTDGYLSERSARLYDQQVEVLFIGSADAMRRQALPPIAAFLRQHRGAAVHLDIGCGTGRFLSSVLDSFHRLRSVGIDLSLPYLAEAARVLRPHGGATLLRGLAENLPVADGSVDVITCVYLLHEVPGNVRGRIAHEIGRVLRPGGRAVIVDSLQYGDRPEWERLLAGFPGSFHEPYYADYAATDLGALFAAAGLLRSGSDLAFLSKILVFDKPPRA